MKNTKSKSKKKVSKASKQFKKSLAEGLDKSPSIFFDNGCPLRAEWNGECYVIISPEYLEIRRLKLEVERINSESIEQMGIAQDTEAALQEVSNEFEAYKKTADGIIEKITDRCHEQAKEVTSLRVANENLKAALKATASAIV